MGLKPFRFSLFLPYFTSGRKKSEGKTNMFRWQSAANLLKRLRRSPSLASPPTFHQTVTVPNSLAGKINFSFKSDCARDMNHVSSPMWILLPAAAVIWGTDDYLVLAEEISTKSSSNDGGEVANVVGLCKIDDGSVITNEHTSKWRIFTDNARDFFMQGKLEEAEKLFISAIQEAKAGFGEKDPHVASACNNLAELYRIKKLFDKAEPLYLEAINILEESFGPDDVRVAVALHNLGQFYLIQRKLEDARRCYEIKGRVLGYNSTDYADTMYHLGTVLCLQGKAKDSEALIQDSIRISEEAGQGESATCIRRMGYLAQIYLKSNRPAEAENVQRKILHIMELSKGWNSLDTVIAGEKLALTLQSTGQLREAKEILEKCLDARKSLLPHDHIQIASNMLHIARVHMFSANQLQKTRISESITELDQAKDYLDNSTRIAQQALSKLVKQKGNKAKFGASGEMQRDGHAALVILLQALDTLALLEITSKLLESGKELPKVHEAENALIRCISAYKEFRVDGSIGSSPQVKNEYLSCLKHLSRFKVIQDAENYRGPTLQELKDEIKRIEHEISSPRKQRN